MGVKIEFKNSNLQATITSLNTNQGLKRYKNAAKGAISYWNKQKEKNITEAEDNIKFFTDALHLCESKLNKIV